MSEKFSRRDFLKGMAVVTASGLLMACGGGNGTPVKISLLLDGPKDTISAQSYPPEKRAVPGKNEKKVRCLVRFAL